MQELTTSKTTDLINRGIIYIVFTIISFLVIYPLVYVISGSFAPGNNIAQMSIIPFADGFTLKHFKHLLFKTHDVKWFFNTLYIAFWTSFLTVITASLSAYVFSRFKFAFKKPMLLSLLILQIFPSFVGMIAIYVILLRIKGYDTLWGLVPAV